VSRVAAVGGRQVNGEATVVAEALRWQHSHSSWVSLPSAPYLGWCNWSWGHQVLWSGFCRFYWCRGIGRLPVSDQRCCLLALAFPVMSVAPQSIDLELLEHFGDDPMTGAGSLMHSASPR